MSGPHRVRLAGFAELLQRVLAHRLQEAISRPVLDVFGHHERLVDEQGELIEDLIALDVMASADRLRGVEVEPAHEDRQSPKQRLLGLGQQRVRPIHRGAQRLLATHRRPSAAGEKAEAVVKAVDDLGQRQRSDARRGELDRQRHAVEATTDFGHRGRVVVGDGEIRPDLSGTVDEQLDRLVVQRQRRHLPRDLTDRPDGLAARRQERHRRTLPQQCGGHRRTRVGKMFTVVQDQQHRSVTDEPHKRVHRRAAGLVGQPERSSHRYGHEIRMRDRRQVDVPHAVVELGRHLTRDLYRETCLTRATGAGQGDKCDAPSVARAPQLSPRRDLQSS